VTEFWEAAFSKMQTAWGLEPTASACLARDYFTRKGAKDVLIPGIGYGRNAKPFLERGMSVTGIEISETAIALSRSRLGLEIPIVHGSVTDMPFDRRQYDGIFCYGLIYLLDARGREKLIRDCHRQLAPGGHMIFTVISKKAPMYGQGPRLGDDWYERLPNLKMYFYDAESVKREFGPYGLLEFSDIDEPSGEGESLPFINVICKRDPVVVGADEAVRRLRAGHVEVTVDGALEQPQVEAIAQALATSKTTILRMGGCHVTDLGGKAIGDALLANTALKELWLFDNEIGDVGCKAIGDALRRNHALATLCLNENRVGDVGARAIGEALRSSTSLVELGLGRNQIGEVGAKAIGDALASNTSVTALNLNHNRIGDVGAAATCAAIAQNIVLTTLHFDGNPASPASHACIEAALKGPRR
jgi:SAM-dependent methyltransferase